MRYNPTPPTPTLHPLKCAESLGRCRVCRVCRVRSKDLYIQPLYYKIKVLRSNPTPYTFWRNLATLLTNHDFQPYTPDPNPSPRCVIKDTKAGQNALIRRCMARTSEFLPWTGVTVPAYDPKSPGQKGTVLLAAGIPLRRTRFACERFLEGIDRRTQSKNKGACDGREGQ